MALSHYATPDDVPFSSPDIGEENVIIPFKTTPIALLFDHAGLSLEEAAEFMNISQEITVDYAIGRIDIEPEMILKIRALIERQREAAANSIFKIQLLRPDQVDLVTPGTQNEAQLIGWPCLGAWRAMAARLFIACPVPVNLIPIGSTANPPSDDESPTRNYRIGDSEI